MVRRILHVLALAFLVLSGPAQGLFAPGAPARCCCCGETGNPGDLGPCGMPKAPCAPRCPQSGTFALLAPVMAPARAQAVQARRAEPRKEPAPWPVALASAALPVPAVAAANHGPPPRARRDPQAALSTFRI